MKDEERQRIERLLATSRRRLNEWHLNFLQKLLERPADRPLREWAAAQLRATERMAS
jgi:hypothetical protein